MLYKAMSCKNKIAHTFLVDETSPEAHTAGPNKGRNIPQIDVRLKARVLFPEMNNQSAWRELAKWLKHPSKHSNKTVTKNGSLGTQLAITEPSYSTYTSRRPQNVKYVRIRQMNTFLGVRTACKFDSGA